VTRPRIEFVQSQKMPWAPHDLSALPAGVEAKVLSSDDETGARSMLLRYPAGYAAPARALTTDEEFLVLDGALEIGGRAYGHFNFGHFPAGFESGERRSAQGAVVLTFFSGRPEIGPPGEYDPERLAEHVDVYGVPYTGNFHPEFPAGAGRKLLYIDPVTKDTTWVLGTLPVRWAERSEVHPTIEEMYLLSGEVHGDRGVMRPGAYFWRPSGEAHGPYGTLTGNLYFFRTKGGSLSTHYVDPEQPFHWWPQYRPVLPASYEAFAGEGDTGARCW